MSSMGLQPAISRFSASSLVLSVLVTLLFGLASCGGRSSSLGDVVAAADSLWDVFDDEPDTQLLATGMTASPEAEEDACDDGSIDELFDDFAFAFDASERLQRCRVVFPITVTTDTSVVTYDSRQWHHPTLFLGLDYCTVLWNTEAEMQSYDDVNSRYAAIEHISLLRRTITAYAFERDSITDRWMLTAQTETGFDHSELASFLDFYRRWAADSVYQCRHLAHTLRYTMADENTEEGSIEGFIAAEQWPEFAPEVPADMLVNVRYGQTYHDPAQIVMQVRGLSNSMQNLLTFRRDGLTWRLTAFSN